MAQTEGGVQARESLRRGDVAAKTVRRKPTYTHAVRIRVPTALRRVGNVEYEIPIGSTGPELSLRATVSCPGYHQNLLYSPGTCCYGTSYLAATPALPEDQGGRTRLVSIIPLAFTKLLADLQRWLAEGT